MAKSNMPPGFKSKNDILAKRAPNRARVDASKREALLRIGLHELRERTGVAQTVIAERMETSRPRGRPANPPTAPVPFKQHP